MVFLEDMEKNHTNVLVCIRRRISCKATNRILKETIPVIKLKDFGFRIAGHNSLRKMKPLKPKKNLKKIDH